MALEQLASEYGEDQFIFAEYHTAYAPSCPASAARVAYYGVSSIPHVFFDGYDGVLGAGSGVYSTYQPIVAAHLAGMAKLSIDAEVFFNEVTNSGEINIDVEVAPGETISNPSECRIRTVIYENGVLFANVNFDHVVRNMLPDVILTAANGGEHQIFTQAVPVPDSLDASQLHAIVFVQRDTNKRILNATKADLMYDVDLSVPSTIASVRGAAVATYDAQVTYTGTIAGDVVVSLDESGLPAGWDAELVWDSVTYPSSFTIPGMTPSQVEDIEVRTITDGSSGLASVTLTVAPQMIPGAGGEAELFTFGNTQSVLLVDDDNGAGLQTFYENAIAGSGHYSFTKNVADVMDAGLSYVSVFDVLVWSTGAMQLSTLDDANLALLRDYLDGGGSLFLSSQGFLSERGVTTFGTDYLRVASWNDDSGTSSAVGVGGDPIGDGLNLTLAKIYIDYTDDLTPGAGAATWLNGSAGPIGLRYDQGGFRTVFLSMPFEFISNTPAAPNNRNVVMGRILDWLSPVGVSDVRPVTASVPGTLLLAQNAPNPFRATTSLQFSIPEESPVSLAIYNIAGRKVAELLNRSLPAGSHTVRWDGRDASGRAVASGVYLYRLQAGGESATKEMVLRR